MEGATIEIESVEPTFRCQNCAALFTAEGYFENCPECGGPSGELVAGDEMLLTSLEVDG